MLSTWRFQSPLLTVLVATLCCCGAFVAAIGPPPGSRGTLDFRYPDYIVDPLVPCPSEDVFPHPRNCTWYYRCYDRYGLGFFWRAYFECEPGTVFSDDLDQCVFGFVNENCKPISFGTPRPPAPPSPQPTPSLPTPAPPTPAPPTPSPPTCRLSYDQCEQRAICPIVAGTSMHVQLVETCAVANNICPGVANSAICSPGQLYDRIKKTCLTASTNYCTPAPPRPSFSVVCDDVIHYCADSYICPNTPFVPEIVRRCNISQVCYLDGVEVSNTPVCPQGQLFDAFKNKCGPNDPAFHKCNPSVGDQFGVPIDPQCAIQSEVCTEMAICSRPGQDGLVCRQLFSCGVATERTIDRILTATRYPSGGNPCIENIPRETTEPPTEPEISSTPTPCSTETSSCSSNYMCPTYPGFSVFVQQSQVCRSAILTCSDGSSGEFCQPGQVYDNSVQVCKAESEICAPITTRPIAPITCEDVTEHCVSQYICPNTPLIPEIIQLCDVVQVCRSETGPESRRQFCGQGERFNVLTNACVPNMPSGNECGPGVVSNPPEAIVCERASEVCTMTPVCDSIDSALVCHKFFACPTGSPSPTSFIRQAYPTPSGPAPPCVHIVWPPPVACERSATAECQEEAFCPQSAITQSQFVSTEEICRLVEVTCSNQTTSYKCQPGEVYAKAHDQCVAGTTLCQGLEQREPSSIVCEDVIKSCQDSYICQRSPFLADVVRRCQLDRVCKRDGVEVSRKSVCVGGSFDAILNQCVLDSPGVYDCSNSIIVNVLPLPECQLQDEDCVVMPGCSSSNETVLNCYQRFSCSPSLATVAARSSDELLQVFGIRQHSEDCEDVPGPDEPVSCDEVSTSQCESVAICPKDAAYQTSLFTNKVGLCPIAEKVCSDGTRTNLCAEGEFYQIDIGQCIAAPVICEAPEPRPSSPIVCVDTLENCKDSHVCPNSPTEKTLQRRCDMFRVCTKDGEQILKESVCPGGSFDAFFNQCVDDAAASFPCVGETPNLPIPVCEIESEKCSETPVCETQEQALVCVHLFSCDGHSTPVIRSAHLPQGNPSCVNIPSIVPAVCENKFDDCSSKGRCPTDIESTQFVQKSLLCLANNVCSDGTSTPLCAPGELYDRNNNVCVQESSLCGPPAPRPQISIVCEDILSSCTDSFICPNTGEPQRIRRCSIDRECRRNGNVTFQEPLCPSRNFDAFNNRCVPEGDQQDQSCSPDALSTLPDPSPGSPVCKEETEVCVEQQVCNPKETGLLCHKVLACEDDNTGYFARAMTRMDGQNCLDAGLTTTGEDEKIAIECSTVNSIPFNEKSRQYYCKKDAMCKPPQNFVGLRETCSEYYQCLIIDNVLTPVKKNCSQGEVLDYKTRQCVQQNKEGYMLCSVLASMTQNPTTSDNPIEVIEITTTTPSPPKEQFALTWSTTLECKVDKEIPVNDEVKRNHCNDIDVCDAGGVFTGEVSLCRKFYVCRLENQHFVIDELECRPGLLFSYEVKDCIAPPPNPCKKQRSIDTVTSKTFVRRMGSF